MEALLAWIEAWLAGNPPQNVWLGATVVNQDEADRDIPKLLALPAHIRFLSCEPLLGPITLRAAWLEENRVYRGDTVSGFLDYEPQLHWLICGGESGPNARPFYRWWADSLRDQCKATGVPIFVKQMGSFVVDRNDAGFDGCDAAAWPLAPDGCDPHLEHDIHGYREDYQGADCRIRLQDRKGGNWNEWPERLRVREFPKVAA